MKFIFNIIGLVLVALSNDIANVLFSNPISHLMTVVVLLTWGSFILGTIGNVWKDENE